MAAPQTESTAQMKQIAPLLVSAGVGRHPDVKDSYLLQATDSTLVSKTWDGRSFTGEAELIASDVRPNSSAVYLLLPSMRYVVAISPSSTLRGIKYDDDEEEWVDDTAFPSIPVHPNSCLTAALDEEDVPTIIFQDPSGSLVHLDASQKTTTIGSARPVGGTPLFAWPKDDHLDVYYVSADDHSVHHVTKGGDGKWSDATLAPATLKETPKNFVVVKDTESGKAQVLALTPSSDMVSIHEEASEVQELGKVEKDGSFVPKVSTECGGTCWYPYPCPRRRPPPHCHRPCPPRCPPPGWPWCC